MNNIAKSLIAVAAAAILASCTTDKHLQQCPSAGILAEASTLTAFRPGAPETPENQLYRVDVTGVQTDCDVEKKQRSVQSSLAITFRAARPKAGPPAQYTVPYFVAVTATGGRVLTKHLFSAPLAFANGATTAQFTQSIDSVNIKVDQDKKAFDYELLAGLQLTKAQLDFNRKFNRYAQ